MARCTEIVFPGKPQWYRCAELLDENGRCNNPECGNNSKVQKPMMKCGHSANAKTAEGKPCCVICIGMDKGATEIVLKAPSLENRVAVCPYCKTENPSSSDLAFFEHRPNNPKDSYYCGCRGWD